MHLAITVHWFGLMDWTNKTLSKATPGGCVQYTAYGIYSDFFENFPLMKNVSMNHYFSSLENLLTGLCKTFHLFLNFPICPSNFWSMVDFIIEIYCSIFFFLFQQPDCLRFLEFRCSQLPSPIFPLLLVLTFFRTIRGTQ